MAAGDGEWYLRRDCRAAGRALFGGGSRRTSPDCQAAADGRLARCHARVAGPDARVQRRRACLQQPASGARGLALSLSRSVRARARRGRGRPGSAQPGPGCQPDAAPHRTSHRVQLRVPARPGAPAALHRQAAAPRPVRADRGQRSLCAGRQAVAAPKHDRVPNLATRGPRAPRARVDAPGQAPLGRLVRCRMDPARAGSVRPHRRPAPIHIPPRPRRSLGRGGPAALQMLPAGGRQESRPTAPAAAGGGGGGAGRRRRARRCGRLSPGR
mmetsp:Transcript_2621/g.8307  ORF Transcript_2621/g.8307 Transcript_2621/m.8307 type:complete len:270 (+) Transcript_2621:398-1207(+)